MLETPRAFSRFFPRSTSGTGDTLFPAGQDTELGVSPRPGSELGETQVYRTPPSGSSLPHTSHRIRAPTCPVFLGLEAPAALGGAAGVEPSTDRLAVRQRHSREPRALPTSAAALGVSEPEPGLTKGLDGTAGSIIVLAWGPAAEP